MCLRAKVVEMGGQGKGGVRRGKDREEGEGEGERPRPLSVGKAPWRPHWNADLEKSDVLI